MATQWCHGSPAALWCGEVLVPLLERLVGVLVDLQMGVPFLFCGFGGMLLALLCSCSARGLHVSGE